MSNKTSDKNVANIERLNNFIEAYKQTKEQSFIVDTINKDFFFEFVDCLLSEREQKDKRIQELEKKNKHLSNVSDYETISLECVHLEEQLEIANSRIQELEEERNHWHGCFIVVMENSIAKEKVKDKIEELRNQINIDICIENNIEKHYELKYKIEVLQELLETK